MFLNAYGLKAQTTWWNDPTIATTALIQNTGGSSVFGSGSTLPTTYGSAITSGTASNGGFSASSTGTTSTNLVIQASAISSPSITNPTATILCNVSTVKNLGSITVKPGAVLNIIAGGTPFTTGYLNINAGGTVNILLSSNTFAGMTIAGTLFTSSIGTINNTGGLVGGTQGAPGVYDYSGTVTNLNLTGTSPSISGYLTGKGPVRISATTGTINATLAGTTSIGGGLGIGSSGTQSNSVKLNLNGYSLSADFINCYSATTILSASGTETVTVSGVNATATSSKLLYMDQTTPGTTNKLGALIYSNNGATGSTSNSNLLTISNNLTVTNPLQLTAGAIAIGTGATLTATGGIVVSPGAALYGPGTISGNVTLQQNIIGQRGWRLFSNPFTTAQSLSGAATASGIAINAASDVKTYDNATDTWDNSLVSGGSVPANTGYALFIRGKASEVTGNNYTVAPSTFKYAVTGTLNPFSAYTVPAASNANNFTIVGNPFPSPVTSSALTNGAGVPYYIYTIAQGANATDQQTKAGQWTAVLTSSNTTIPVLGCIAWSPSANTTTPTTSYSIAAPTNTVGTYTATTTLFETAPSFIELTVNKAGVYEDHMYLRSAYNASNNGTDKIDLKKLSNDNFNMYSIAPDNGHLAVDTRSVFNQNIPLGISGDAGNYSLVVSNNTLVGASKVTLKDNYLQKTTELGLGDQYDFTINSSAASKGEGRFVLVFASANFSTTSTLADGNAETKLSAKIKNSLVSYNGTITINIAGSNGPAKIMITDNNGRILKNVAAANGSNTIQVADISKGVHFVQISDTRNSIIQKIIKL
ncbi:MAG: T9SS type A sorting domain-containing protein [Chitinophagaceae bacterium]|nr:T9SS type A sorting domain-containing protein [Chitinophagaceae bacterium]